jgi:hypothetical protein
MFYEMWAFGSRKGTMSERKSIENKIKEIIARLGDPCKYDEDEAGSVLLSDSRLVEVVEKDNRFYLRPKPKRDGYINPVKYVDKEWEEVEVEKQEAYPYFITRAGIHHCYDGSSDDLGFVYKLGEVERIAPKGADAYRIHYDSYERHEIGNRDNGKEYDLALIDFYKINRNQSLANPKGGSYSSRQISSALGKLGLSGLEKQIISELNKSGGNKQ